MSTTSAITAGHRCPHLLEELELGVGAMLHCELGEQPAQVRVSHQRRQVDLCLRHHADRIELAWGIYSTTVDVCAAAAQRHASACIGLGDAGVTAQTDFIQAAATLAQHTLQHRGATSRMSVGGAAVALLCGENCIGPSLKLVLASSMKLELAQRSLKDERELMIVDAARGDRHELQRHKVEWRPCLVTLIPGQPGGGGNAWGMDTSTGVRQWGD